MEQILEKRGRPMPQDELVEAVIDAGFDAETHDSLAKRKGNVKRSIRAYTKGIAGKRKAVLRVERGMVGLGCWPDGLFEA